MTQVTTESGTPNQSTAAQVAAQTDGTTPEDKSSKGNSAGPDESKWDDDTKSYIAKLRKENGERRTKSKDMETRLTATQAQLEGIRKALGITEDLSPEDELKVVNAQLYETQNDAFLKGIALEKGISFENYEYFQFLVNKRASQLEDGQELGDEDLDKIVTEVKKRTNTMTATSVTAPGASKGEGAPSTHASGDITLQQFNQMTITQRTELFQKSPDTYSRLMSEHRLIRKQA